MSTKTTFRLVDVPFYPDEEDVLNLFGKLRWHFDDDRARAAAVVAAWRSG